MVLAGGAAAGVVAVAPLTFSGLEGFLRRTVADHFGKDLLTVEGIDDFVRDFVETVGDENFIKRLASDYYFGISGDRIHKTGAVRAFEERFLRSLLSRSNVIAIYQGASTEFEYQNPDPWAPQCGLYLSSFAEDA